LAIIYHPIAKKKYHSTFLSSTVKKEFASFGRQPFREEEKGVLLGFWYGNKLNDVNGYLTRGTNKQIFYKIYRHVDEINEKQIILLLNEAIQLDRRW
jgi:hypothetical protein